MLVVRSGKDSMINGQDASWWETAVVYQVYIRSFADDNGDGIGDIAGLRSRLPYLAALGVDAVWINPWYPSPMADAGYDVADYRDIEPSYGTLAEAEALIADAHSAGYARCCWTSSRTTPRTSTAGSRPRWLPARSPERTATCSVPVAGATATAAERLAERLRRSGLDRVLADGRRAVVPAPVRTRAAGPQLVAPRGAGGVREDAARSGSTRVWTASASTWRTAW